MQIKIIFLDFDGVLNSYHKRYGRSNEYQGIYYEAQDLDPELIQKLNSIIEKTNSLVVVSSAWRYSEPLNFGYKKDDLQKILEFRGFKGRVIDITPCFINENFYSDEALKRADEIQNWLDATDLDVYSYVVLDDSDDDDLHRFNNKFVLIENKDGLKDNHVEEAIRILNMC